ncbi:hypothetical protein ACEPAI_2509 [Sanghuangporus weigelae]
MEIIPQDTESTQTWEPRTEQEEDEENENDNNSNNSEQTRASSHPTHISAPRTSSQSPHTPPPSPSSPSSSSSSSMATQVFHIAGLDLRDLFKAFDGVEKLQHNGSNFKMWLIRVEATMLALGLEDHLVSSPPANDTDGQTTNNQLISVFQSKVPDSILSNMIGINRVILFINHLKTRFDVRTTVTSAVEVSKLFNIRGHVSEFDKTLDKLQNIYGLLTQHNKKPTDDTYLSAIQTSTPPQYGYVFQQLQARIDFYNSTLTANQPRRTVTPDGLIAKLRAAFANYQAQKQPSATPSTFRGRATSSRGRIFSYRSHFNQGMNRNPSYPQHANPNYPGSTTQFWKGPWDNRNYFRGRGRGRSNFTYKHFTPHTHAVTGALQCFNCKKFGHMSKDCRAPPTPKTLKIRQSRPNSTATASLIMQASTNYTNPNAAAQAIIPSYALPPSNTTRIKEVNMASMRSKTPVLPSESNFTVNTPSPTTLDLSDDENPKLKRTREWTNTTNPFERPVKRQQTIATQLAAESSSGTNFVDDFWEQMTMQQDPNDDGVLLEGKSLFDLIDHDAPISSFANNAADQDFIEEHGYHPMHLNSPTKEQMDEYAATMSKREGKRREKEINIIERAIPDDVPMEYVQSCEPPTTPPSPFLKKAI